MGDVMDRAQERGQEWLHDQLAHQAVRAARQRSAVQVLDCEDCGEAIPPARRRALPGVRRCVECQALHERQGARGACRRSEGPPPSKARPPRGAANQAQPGSVGAL